MNCYAFLIDFFNQFFRLSVALDAVHGASIRERRHVCSELVLFFEIRKMEVKSFARSSVVSPLTSSLLLLVVRRGFSYQRVLMISKAMPVIAVAVGQWTRSR
jgi:hypothetical protein